MRPRFLRTITYFLFGSGVLPIIINGDPNNAGWRRHASDEVDDLLPRPSPRQLLRTRNLGTKESMDSQVAEGESSAASAEETEESAPLAEGQPEEGDGTEAAMEANNADTEEQETTPSEQSESKNSTSSISGREYNDQGPQISDPGTGVDKEIETNSTRSEEPTSETEPSNATETSFVEEQSGKNDTIKEIGTSNAENGENAAPSDEPSSSTQAVSIKEESEPQESGGGSDQEGSPDETQEAQQESRPPESSENSPPASIKQESGSEGENPEPQDEGKVGKDDPDDNKKEGKGGKGGDESPSSPSPTSPAGSPDRSSNSNENDEGTMILEDQEEFREEIEKEERKAWRLGGFGIFVAVAGMVFTAWQMSENPDGIYAAMCRLIITVLGLVFRLLLSPCWGFLGGSHSNRQYGHVPVSTMDYGYRDPSLEMAGS